MSLGGPWGLSGWVWKFSTFYWGLKPGRSTVSHCTDYGIQTAYSILLILNSFKHMYHGKLMQNRTRSDSCNM